MTLTYFLKVEDLNRDHWGSLNGIISQTMRYRTNTAFDSTYEVAYWLLIDIFTIDLDPF